MINWKKEFSSTMINAHRIMAKFWVFLEKYPPLHEEIEMIVPPEVAKSDDGQKSNKSGTSNRLNAGESIF